MVYYCFNTMPNVTRFCFSSFYGQKIALVSLVAWRKQLNLLVAGEVIDTTSLPATTVNFVVYERYNDGGKSFWHEIVAVKHDEGRSLTN
jgi:hypothetical protein